MILTVGTITIAIKARKLLSRSGINSKLIKINPKNAGLGCVYGLQISASDFYNAVVELKNNGIEYSLYKEE